MSTYDLIFLIVLLFAGLSIAALLIVCSHKSDTEDGTLGYGTAGVGVAVLTIVGCSMSFDKMTDAHAPNAQTPKTDIDR